MTSTPDHRESENESDPLLDSLLDEVLGGHGPPDLKGEILAQWRSQAATTNTALEGGQPPLPVVVTAQDPVARRVGRGTRRRLPASSIVAAACLLAALTTWFVFRPTDRPMADRNPGTGQQVPASPVSRPPAPRPVLPAEDDGASVPSDASPVGAESSDPVPQSTPDERWSPPVSPSNPILSQLARLDDATVVAQLNQRLRDRWQQQQIEPAQAVSDEVWCRRLYQHLIGREPYATELRDFLGSPAEDRRVVLVDQLLGQAYVDEYSERWAQRWTDWLLQGIVADSRAYRTGLQTHLATMLSANRPYDRICAELITASGTNDPAASDFNGATNYLLALREKAEASDLTSQVGRAMLGQRLACAQCHDDRVHERDQAEFWQLAATLNSIRIEVLRPARRARLGDADAQRDVSLPYDDADIGPSRAAPGGLDGRLLALAADRPLRAQLADQFVTSDSFARAAVNRFWTAFLHYGFTLPVDDLGRHNPVSHPELVDLLCQQFVAHDYDLKHLMRWIALSDAFNRSDVIMTVNAKDAPTEGGEAFFSRYYHRPVLFSFPRQGLVQLAAGNVPQVTHSSDTDERKDLMANRYGDPNRLASSGSDQMGQLLPSHYLGQISALTSGNLSVDQQFEHAYQVVLNRGPNAEEQAQAAAILQAAEGNTQTALERVFWVLLNSNP